MGDLYVWDPEEHYPGVEISSIEQAEEIATDYEGHPINEKIRNWLKDVRDVVLDPNLKANFTDFMINDRFQDILEYYKGYPSNVFVEDDPLRGTPYLYKVMVEKLREHGLYGFDGGAYVFYSQDQVFPDGEDVLAYLDGIEPITADEMLALKKLPQTEDQLFDFLKKDWLVAQKDLGFKLEVRPEFFDSERNYRQITPNIIETISFKTNSNATIEKISLTKYLKISDNHTITLSHYHKQNVKLFTRTCSFG